MIFDPLYLLFISPGFLLALWASYRVRSAFSRYSKVVAESGYTGAEAAQRLLDRAGIHDVRIVPTHGFLGDYDNPVTKELALSEEVYQSRSVAAIGVATHEAGHAIQHATHYFPLWVRSALVHQGLSDNGACYRSAPSRREEERGGHESSRCPA